MTGMQIGQMSATMEAFGMKHASRALPDLLELADRNDLTCREFLERVLVSETEGRFARKRKRNYASAHFPPGVKPIDEFDPAELESGVTAGQIERLKELDWLDSHGNVVLAGPPGLGKTMIALGLGLLAVDAATPWPSIRWSRSSIRWTGPTSTARRASACATSGNASSSSSTR